MEFDLLKAALHKCVGLSEVEAFSRPMAQGHDSQQQPDEHAMPYKKVKLDHLVK